MSFTGEVLQARLPMFADPDPGEDNSIDARFLRFHNANPWVYRELVNLARQAVRAQHRRGVTKARVGVGALYERLRWDYVYMLRGTGDYKLNNDYRSRYARLIAATEPDLAEVFELRALNGGGDDAA